MVHRLPRSGAAVRHQAIAAVGNPFGSGDIGRNSHKVPNDGIVTV
jgi:hypothetical protein